jgi:hypothetical protein
MHGNFHNESDNTSQNRFGRLIEGLEPFRPEEEHLRELGRAMSDDRSDRASNIPAGYTYLGQFIDHDMSKDPRIDEDPIKRFLDNMPQPRQLRTPSLDLDCLYGSGETKAIVAWDPEDPAKFLLGETIAEGEIQSFKNDLPRNGHGAEPAKALIGDPRNEENLAVAQIHLAFLKFHNAVVDLVRLRNLNNQLDAITIREQAREIVVLHYHSIVLHDFLEKFVNTGIYENVITNNNPRFFIVKEGELPFMPEEFSGAAYRWHTLIRNSYNWNKFFHHVPNSTNTPKADGLLIFLFQFTGFGNNNQFVGRASNKNLSSDWIIDWTRFFDFSDRGLEKGEGFNFTEPLDTLLVSGLQNPQINLAVKNLIRGSRYGLPSAQDLAAALEVPILTPDEILSDSKQEEVLRKHNFHQSTPLWYYINREAEILGDSLRFGPLASTIVCETFHGLAKGSKHSILHQKNEGWKPDSDLLPSNPDFYTFADLLWFVRASSKSQNDSLDELNPLK